MSEARKSLLKEFKGGTGCYYERVLQTVPRNAV